MGEKIVGTEEKRKELKRMENNDKYSSSDMVSLIMREKVPSELNIPMENVENNLASEEQQRAQLDIIADVKKAKAQQTNNPNNLKAVTLHTDSKGLDNTTEKTTDEEELEH